VDVDLESMQMRQCVWFRNEQLAAMKSCEESEKGNSPEINAAQRPAG
jgi:hypothetical protein